METQEKTNDAAQSVEKSANEGAATDAQRVDEGETHVSEREIARALCDEGVRERLIYGNESLMNAVIGRYLDELAGGSSVPVVRGYASLRPVRKPKTLEEAKRIVDGGV